MPAAKLLIGLVFTSGWACAHSSSFVPQSSELIPGPVVTAEHLPGTLSLDALTPAEVGAIRAEVLQVQRKQGPHPSEGIEGCMAWLYRRSQPGAPWQPFGFVVDKSWMAVKLNGQLRQADHFYYAWPAQDQPAFLGMKSVPTAGPGHGAASITDFTPIQGFADLLSRAEAHEVIDSRVVRDRAEPDTRSLEFLNTASIKVERSRMRCTDLQTHCRRYVFTLDKPTAWSGWSPRVSEPIALAATAPLEIAVEDMCPFSRRGFIQQARNTRVSGAASAVPRRT